MSVGLIAVHNLSYRVAQGNTETSGAGASLSLGKLNAVGPVPIGGERTGTRREQ